MKLFPDLENEEEKKNLKNNLSLIFGFAFFAMFFLLYFNNAQFALLSLTYGNGEKEYFLATGIFGLLTAWTVVPLSDMRGMPHLNFSYILDNSIRDLVDKVSTSIAERKRNST